MAYQGMLGYGMLFGCVLTHQGSVEVVIKQKNASSARRARMQELQRGIIDHDEADLSQGVGSVLLVVRVVLSNACIILHLLKFNHFGIRSRNGWRTLHAGRRLYLEPEVKRCFQFHQWKLTR